MWQCWTLVACSSGVESVGHSARKYCTVAGHYSRSSQPLERKESSFYPVGFYVKSCLLFRLL